MEQQSLSLHKKAFKEHSLLVQIEIAGESPKHLNYIMSLSLKCIIYTPIFKFSYK